MSRAFKFISFLCISIFMTSVFQSCEEAESIDINDSDLIPIPNRIKATSQVFEITSKTPINLIGNDTLLRPIAEAFKSRIKNATGYDLKVYSKSGASNGINIGFFEEGRGRSESYQLDITSKNIVLSGRDGAGLFYGVQTLIQLLPPEIEANSLQEVDWKLGTGSISDAPDYAYRGAMLDVARHFFNVEEVKQYINYMAMYKLNRLHLHLSDDQGWRIEIKSWPNLTKIGGSTEVGGGAGGFYTQEQYKEIVQYAADRFITIVPEIDMPGHTNAALASYPELNCNNKATDLYTGIEVGFSSLCVDKEITYQFADDVIRELAAMTPGEYLHIGGDETHATSEKDYIKFMNRVQKSVVKYGKKVMAWDELSVATPIDSTVVVQFWDSEENAKMGVLKGAKVLVSPAKRAYMDMQYDSTTRLGLHWAAYIEADDAYTWDPVKYAKGLKKEDIIGVEAPLWSETVTNMDDIEYMIFPRITALAEIAWTREEYRSWESYSSRLAKHGSRLKVQGVNFYASPKIDWNLKEIEK